MDNRRNLARNAIGLALIAGFVGTAAGAQAAEGQKATVSAARTTVEAMHQAAVKDDVTTLDRHVAYDAIAKTSLANHWGDFNDQERKQFLENFRKIVRSTYQKGLGGKSKKALNITGETSEGAASVIHTSVAMGESDRDLVIDYQMQCEDKHCELIDVVTDGSSLVQSWKRMFRRIVKKHGKGELLSRIAKKARTVADQ